MSDGPGHQYETQPRLRLNIELVWDTAPFGGAERLADLLAALLGQTNGVMPVRIRVPEDTPRDDPSVQDDPLLGEEDPPAQAQAQDEGKPPPRVRDKKAERARAKARAEAEAEARAKADAQAPAPVQKAEDDDPLMGDAANGQGDPFDEPIPAPEAPVKSRTPAEYMDAAIIILRQCYGVPGGNEQVKVIQKEFKVSQFTQVPPERAGALYNRALALANTMGVNLPPGV